MPTKPPHGCAVDGCPELVRDGSYCATHARERTRAHDENRPTSTKRGYGARWQKLRLMFLRSNPICADPFGVHVGQLVAATEVDHITPKSQGGADAWTNLQPLCKSCHSRKTLGEQRTQRGADAATQPPERRP